MRFLTQKTEIIRLWRVRIRRFLNFWSKYQLYRRGYLEFLKLRPRQAFGVDYADQWFLYSAICKNKPKCVLEFGSGFSTVMIAQALLDNSKESPGLAGKIYSVDSQPFWAEAFSRAMPKHLIGFWEIFHCPLEKIYYDGILVFRHVGVPDVVPDLVYIDGPVLTAEMGAASDVLFFEERFQPGLLIVVDGRSRQVAFLREHLKRRYRLKNNWLLGNYVFELIE